ncbi:hypothetical protein Tco_0871191 [Tanacetum coccineum]
MNMNMCFVMLGLEQEDVPPAYLFLVERPDKMRALMGCPRHMRVRRCNKMLEWNEQCLAYENPSTLLLQEARFSSQATVKVKEHKGILEWATEDEKKSIPSFKSSNDSFVKIKWSIRSCKNKNPLSGFSQ